MTNNLEPFKELYDTLKRIRDLPERSDTLITQALELVLELEDAYKLVESENDELSGKYNGCVIERNIALRKLENTKHELDRAYSKIGKAHVNETTEQSRD